MGHETRFHERTSTLIRFAFKSITPQLARWKTSSRRQQGGISPLGVVREEGESVSPFQSLLSLRGFFSRNLCFTRRPSCLLEKVSTISISRAGSPLHFLPSLAHFHFPIGRAFCPLPLLQLNNRTLASRLWLRLKNFPINSKFVTTYASLRSS